MSSSNRKHVIRCQIIDSKTDGAYTYVSVISDLYSDTDSPQNEPRDSSKTKSRMSFKIVNTRKTDGATEYSSLNEQQEGKLHTTCRGLVRIY